MIITKKALPRRTFLKGAQAVLALPLLDAMIPAATAWAQTPAKPVPRLGFVYVPMGCDHSRWTPPGQDTLAELSPILSPLERVKNHVTVIHGWPGGRSMWTSQVEGELSEGSSTQAILSVSTVLRSGTRRSSSKPNFR